jgi:hypothetical protein
MDEACYFEILISTTFAKTQQATHRTKYVPVPVQVMVFSIEVSGVCPFRTGNPTRSRVHAA